MVSVVTRKSPLAYFIVLARVNTNLVKYLTGKLSDSAPALNTVLVNACRLGDTGFVSFLLTLPLINMEFKDYQCFTAAAECNRLDIVKLLLEKGAKPVPAFTIQCLY